MDQLTNLTMIETADKVGDARIELSKARTIMDTLANSYGLNSFGLDQNTKNKIACEAERLVIMLHAAYDYVLSADKSLSIADTASSKPLNENMKG